jgi:hypothetical protein
MRAGFNLYQAVHRDVLDNEAFIASGKLQMPILCYGGTHGRGRGMSAIESWRRVATAIRKPRTKTPVSALWNFLRIR